MSFSLDLGSVLYVLMFGGFAFVMMQYFPTRNEYEEHKKHEDERNQGVKETLARIERSIKETKEDLLRELKNGNNRHNPD